jgi:hypothetical protein
MGALKGRWQCLRSLCVNIRNNTEHIKACRWITIAIILHNAVIDLEGAESESVFLPTVGDVNENATEVNAGNEVEAGEDDDEISERKWEYLVKEVNLARRRE